MAPDEFYPREPYAYPGRKSLGKFATTELGRGNRKARGRDETVSRSPQNLRTNLRIHT